jgi:hypothetical protein
LEIPRRLFVAWIPDDGPREIRRVLTADERWLLEARATALQDALRPFSENERNMVRLTVSTLLGGYRAMRHHGEDVEGAVEVTLAVLRNFPAWAITRGCAKIARDGIVRDGVSERRWAPNDAEISGIVGGIVREYQGHMRQAFALLTAPVEKPTPPRPNLPAAPRPRPVRDGYAQRVMADIEARRAKKESGNGIDPAGTSSEEISRDA